MKEDRSIIISCYHSYVIQNRTRFLSYSDLIHLILISWNCDLISSHEVRVQSHSVSVSCWFQFCFISQVIVQSHLILISCHSDLVSSHLIEIWFHLISFHENLILFDLISQKFWSHLISFHKDLISFWSQARMRQDQDEIFWFWQSVYLYLKMMKYSDMSVWDIQIQWACIS